MSAQLPLLAEVERTEPAGRPWRLTRATSKAAWYAVRARLTQHEQAVFWGLLAYWNRYQHWPTAMELFEFLRALRRRKPHHPRYRLIHDINNVRPRLTTMNQYDPPMVVTGPKRACRSARAREANTHLQVLTYRIPQVGERVRDGRPHQAA